jgi:hypothetical protein
MSTKPVGNELNFDDLIEYLLDSEKKQPEVKALAFLGHSPFVKVNDRDRIAVVASFLDIEESATVDKALKTLDSNRRLLLGDMCGHLNKRLEQAQDVEKIYSKMGVIGSSMLRVIAGVQGASLRSPKENEEYITYIKGIQKRLRAFVQNTGTTKEVAANKTKKYKSNPETITPRVIEGPLSQETSFNRALEDLGPLRKLLKLESDESFDAFLGLNKDDQKLFIEQALLKVVPPRGTMIDINVNLCGLGIPKAQQDKILKENDFSKLSEHQKQAYVRDELRTIRCSFIDNHKNTKTIDIPVKPPEFTVSQVQVLFEIYTQAQNDLGSALMEAVIEQQNANLSQLSQLLAFSSGRSKVL